MLDKVFSYDIENFSKELLEAIANDQVIFRDGVAYWKKGLEQVGIIQHIPLKEVSSVGIESFIQPGGSVRDKDSIEYCVNNGLAMVITGLRHFKH